MFTLRPPDAPLCILSSMHRLVSTPPLVVEIGLPNLTENLAQNWLFSVTEQCVQSADHIRVQQHAAEYGLETFEVARSMKQS